MHVVSYKRIRKFSGKHPDSSVALRSWYVKMKRIKPAGYHELKKQFPGVDRAGNGRYIFNIKGNKYLLVVLIFFDTQVAYIRFIGTHAEYDRINCTEI